MFTDIAKGLQNPLQQLRLGIITLTTLFPRQIRFVASLTRKILGPPARLIKKLLIKASNVLGNLFKRAGLAIFNLVKNPIKNLTKRVLGQAGTQTARGVGKFLATKAAPVAAKVAGKAVGAAGKAANVLKRFKFLSKIFKRVPFVGALIGIGIDLAMGERIDVAVAGAAGASLGAAIGGAIGTGLIPLPFVGTWVGAGVGSAIGDWAGKAIYSKMTGIQSTANKEVPVEARQGGGGSGGTALMARARGRTGQKPQSAPSQTASKLSPKTQDNAEKNIFKDEKHLNVFSEIREKLKTSSFVGELLQLGADMAIGERISKTRTDIAAQQIGSSIGKAFADDEIKIFGLNKKLIGAFSEGITNWAKGKIFKDLTSISFPSYDKVKEESADDSARTPTSPGSDPTVSGGAGGSSASYGAPEVKALLDAIAFAEGTTKSYGVISGGDVNKDLEAGKLTVQQVIDLGNTFGKPGSKHKWSGATGRYQFMPGTLNGMVQRGYLKATDLFTPQMQDKAGWQLAVNRGVTLDMLKKEGMSQNVADKLAPEWASFPYSPKGGKSYYGQGYKTLAKLKKVYDQKIGYHQDIAKKGGGGHGGQPPVASGDLKNKKIFLHWSAGDYNTPYPAYHSIVLGSGKKVQNAPYDKDKSGHTAGGNANSVGLAVAAAAGATEDNVKTPPTPKQLDVMTSEAANLAKGWGWTAANVDSNVRTHGEWERYAVPAGILPPPVRRWDLDRLSNSDKFGSGGPKLRAMIKSKMSAMGVGGGTGNRGPVNKSTLMGGAIGGTGTSTPSKNPSVDVSSNRGMRWGKMHQGVDIVPTGKDLHMPLYLPLDAKITDNRVEGNGDSGYGNSIYFTTSDGITHLYAHMKSQSRLRVGQSYPKGTLVGYMGYSGSTYPKGPGGTHLHWETATKESDVGRNGPSLFNALSKYSKFAPFTKSGTSPDPSLPIDSPSPGPGQSPTSPGSPDIASKTSQPEDVSWIDPNFNIAGAPAKESYLQALREGTYVKRQDTQSISQGTYVKRQDTQSISQRTDSIMQTPEYASNGGNNVLIMPIGSPTQQSAPSGGSVNSGGSFVSLGDMDSYSKSLDGVVVTALYRI
jgi:murein DD-endopeptidase MepM/ murein hydrolase activator NlpD/muramidase (phage lysozyme)